MSEEKNQTAQPSTLGQCSDCGKGWYKWDQDVEVYLCNKCGKEPRGAAGVTREKRAESGLRAVPDREPADATDLEDSDKDPQLAGADQTAQSLREATDAKTSDSASPQGTLDIVKPSPAALRIARAWLSARDVRRKIEAFQKQLKANLDKQMECDKVDHIEVDGVPFSRIKTSEVKPGTFEDWTPAEDSTEAIMKLLGLTAAELGQEPSGGKHEDDDRQATLA